MKYLEQFNALLFQVPFEVAFLLGLIGVISFGIMFTKFGKTKKGVAVCIPGYLVGAIGAMSLMMRILAV